MITHAMPRPQQNKLVTVRHNKLVIMASSMTFLTWVTGMASL
jgi:hypothetical protein